MALAGEAGSIPTRLKVSNSPPAFHGKVKSQVPECESDRRVKVFKEKRNGERRVLGRTDSDADGKWLIEVDPLRSGAYIAKAKQHIVDLHATPGPDRRRARGGVVVCEADFAPGIFVD